MTSRLDHSRTCSERHLLLNAARLEDTSLLARDGNFRRDLNGLYGHVTKEAPLSRSEESLKVAILQKLIRLAPLMIGIDLRQEDVAELHIEEMLTSILILTRSASYIYSDFVQHLLLRTQLAPGALAGARVVFSGRDSFPFLLAYREARRFHTHLPSPHYAPFNRFHVRDIRWTKNGDVSGVSAELSRYYVRANLAGQDLVVVDFGFRGSLENAHGIVLGDDVRARSLFHYLFMSSVGSVADMPDNSTRIAGYLNELADAKSTIASAYCTGDARPLVYCLQELGSGINESRADSLRLGEKDYRGTHYKYAPLQAIACYLAYLRGIAHHLNASGPNRENRDSLRERAESGLTLLMACYTKYPSFFGALVPKEDMLTLNGVLDERLLRLTEKLLSAGFPSVSAIAEFQHLKSLRSQADAAHGLLTSLLEVAPSLTLRLTTDGQLQAEVGGLEQRATIGVDVVPLLAAFASPSSAALAYARLLTTYDFSKDEFTSVVQELLAAGILRFA